MKKFLLVATVLIGALTVKAQDKKPDDVIKVNTEVYDFGKIKQSVPVTTYFEITNISDKAIVIENVTAGCGCTTPEVPKEPIAPGATSKIKVGFNAAALNHFSKDVNIKIAGVPTMKTVKITGDVMAADAYEAYAKDAKKNSDDKKGKQ